MEQRTVLPLGAAGSRLLTPEEVARRLAAAPSGGQRRSQDAGARGDHDLNPGRFPDRPLVPAAVLVPLVERPAGLTVLFTLRNAQLADHAGQISFPGGRIDPDDADEKSAALREAQEEIGLPPSQVRLIGRLDTYVTRTGFCVVPQVGLIAPPLVLRPDPHEVAEIFETPLDYLLDPAHIQRDSRIYEGGERFYWAIRWEGRYIWGATAGMLVNLAEVLRGRL
jgi:8-oxo-dGTP pyrophosphatase MutT (NUDIX family)